MILHHKLQKLSQYLQIKIEAKTLLLNLITKLLQLIILKFSLALVCR